MRGEPLTPTLRGVQHTPPSIFLIPGERGEYTHEQLLALYADGFPSHTTASLYVISEDAERLLFTLIGNTDAAGKLFVLLPIVENGPYAMPAGQYRLEIAVGGEKQEAFVVVGEKGRQYEWTGCAVWPEQVRAREEAVLFCVGEPGARYQVRGSDGTAFDPVGDVRGLWVFLFQAETSTTWWIDTSSEQHYEVHIYVEEESP